MLITGWKSICSRTSSRDLVEVAAVALGQDHLGQPGGVRRQHLLLQPADRQHPSLQGDLSGHPDGVLDGAAGEQADQRGGHRRAGAGAVLGDRPGRDVQVELPLEGLGRNAQLLAVRPDVGEGDPRRLLHHVAELAGEDQALVAVHRGRLDEEDVSAGAGHGQAGRDPRDRGALDRLLEDLLPAQASRAGTRRRSRPWHRPGRSPAAILVAAPRSSLPISRSSWRTPASRVYSAITPRRTSSPTSTSSAPQAVALQLPRQAGSPWRSPASPRSCSRRS